MSKTAMQLLKDEIERKVIPPNKNDGELSDYQYGHNVAYGVVLTIIEYLLEKEKDQLYHSFYAGGGVTALQDFKEEFDKYYNEVYNQNK